MVAALRRTGSRPRPLLTHSGQDTDVQRTTSTTLRVQWFKQKVRQLFEDDILVQFWIYT